MNSRTRLTGLALVALALGACAVDADLSSDSEATEASSSALRGSVRASTAKTIYQVGDFGESTLSSSVSSTYLPGCSEFSREKKESGVWVDQGPNKICKVAGNARLVGKSSTWEFWADEPGTYRLRYTVGLQCKSTDELSKANCAQVKQVHTNSYSVTAKQCNPGVANSCPQSLVCVADSVDGRGRCLNSGHGQKVGLGYPCNASMNIVCASGLHCQGLEFDIEGGGGTCGLETPCDPNLASTCPADLVCVADDLKHFGVCKPSASGQNVGNGYECAGWKDVGCATGLVCRNGAAHFGSPGICVAPQVTDWCAPHQPKSCGDDLVCVGDDLYSGSCGRFAHGQNVGRGYTCGGSIGVGCVTGLVCNAPTDVLGGTGICEPRTCDPAQAKSCGQDLVCSADDVTQPGTCEAYAQGRRVGAGYGCNASMNIGCASGLECGGQWMGEPFRGIPKGFGGTCTADPKCNPIRANDCPAGLVCVAQDLNRYGMCKPFAHGQNVGKGYTCGGSIGVGCASGLACNAPTGVLGGTGTCGPDTTCDPAQAKSCGGGLVCVADDVTQPGTCERLTWGGQRVGAGYPCTTSTNFECASGLHCKGVPFGDPSDIRGMHSSETCGF